MSAVRSVPLTVTAGVRLLVSGIMACANFLARLFSDALRFLVELGQKVWGVLQQFAEAIAGLSSACFTGLAGRAILLS